MKAPLRSAVTLTLTLVLVSATAPAAARPGPSAGTTRAFLKLLDRPRVPADPREVSRQTDAGGLVTEILSIASEKKRGGEIERVPLLMVHPAGTPQRRPVVIVLHGTGGNKEGQRPLLVTLAEKGFLAVAIDARYHGARAAGAKGADLYVAKITEAWRAPAAVQEHPFFYDTVRDLWRTVDYLRARPDVDGDRLGMVGFSMGGIQTWLAAAADQRIKVVVPLIAVQSFRFNLENDQWQGRARTIQPVHDAAARDLGEASVNARVVRRLWDKLLPGILDRFDGPAMLPLIAPRPLFIANGELDPNCPIGGARLAFAAAERAYARAGARDRLQILVAPNVAHKVTDDQRAAALVWLVRWLKPAP